RSGTCTAPGARSAAGSAAKVFNAFSRLALNTPLAGWSSGYSRCLPLAVIVSTEPLAEAANLTLGSRRKAVSESSKLLTTWPSRPVRVLAIRPSRATATNLVLTRLTTSSVQTEGARPPLAAAQQLPTGAPPEPLQTRIGLPSAAACLRAFQMLNCQGIS